MNNTIIKPCESCSSLIHTPSASSPYHILLCGTFAGRGVNLLVYAMKKNECGVYRFIHIASGRSYVGSSLRIASRKHDHLNAARKGATGKFYSAVREFGEDAFSFEIVEICEANIRLEREKFYIEKFDAVASGFNMMKDPTFYAFSNGLPEEIKKRISESLIGNKHLLGYVPTKEFRENHSKRMLGNSYAKGNKLSAETRRKMSESKKGKTYLTPEQYKAIGDKKRGRPQSLEARLRTSAAAKRRMSDPNERLKASLKTKAYFSNPENRDNFRRAIRASRSRGQLDFSQIQPTKHL